MSTMLDISALQTVYENLYKGSIYGRNNYYKRRI